MFRNLIALTVTPLVLASCVLDQEAPHPPVAPPPGSPALGVVVMEDFGGNQQVADFKAKFGKKNSAKSAHVHARGMAVLRRDARAPQCKIKKQAISPSTSESAATDTTITLVSAGRIGVGPALSQTLLAVDPDDKANYFLKLTPGFPNGAYQVVAEGTSDLGKFSELLSMPDVIQDVKGNGTNFGNAEVIVKRTDPLKINWRTPSFPPDDSQVMLADIYAVTSTDLYLLECGAAEKDLLTSASVAEWDIPVDELQQLPATPKAEVHLVRVIDMNARNGFQGVLEGAREMVAPASIN